MSYTHSFQHITRYFPGVSPHHGVTFLALGRAFKLINAWEEFAMPLYLGSVSGTDFASAERISPNTIT